MAPHVLFGIAQTSSYLMPSCLPDDLSKQNRGMLEGVWNCGCTRWWLQKPITEDMDGRQQ
ncbi:hypothetical protein BRADI_3g27534v3 [Brachypodium distachyon]|uniref:Uncharacterized protein n=1 Tax=Brachypodium distachyon TaxID=15368 RepID=A0A2K2CZJ5_BRADI|nr:hypothetical protein BRADI_3g27534v3 [Brachypodium distachyon]